MSFDFNRPISKAIAAANIAQEVIYRLARFAKQGDPPTQADMAEWEYLRVPLAEVILPHIDAYDQR